MAKHSPLRACIERLPDGRGCPRLAEPGRSRCAEHEQQRQAEQYDGRKSYQWQKTRQAVIARDRHCQHPGCTTATELQIHHIDSDTTHNDLSNLVALCRRHHSTEYEALSFRPASRSRLT